MLDCHLGVSNAPKHRVSLPALASDYDDENAKTRHRCVLEAMATLSINSNSLAPQPYACECNPFRLFAFCYNFKINPFSISTACWGKFAAHHDKKLALSVIAFESMIAMADRLTFSV